MTDSVPDEPTDLLFALVSGLYASVVAVPPAVLAASPRLTAPGAMYLAVVAGTALVTAAVTVAVRRTDGLAVRIGASSARFLPAVVPAMAVAAVAWGYTQALGRLPSGFAVLLGGIAGIGGLALGGTLAVMADTRYARAVTARAETLHEWRAPWPEGHRRLAKHAGIGVVVAAAGAFVAGAVLNRPVVRYGGQFALPFGVVVASWGQERTYRATSAGLETQAPVRRHLADWERFDGYMITDTAIIIHPTAPWRLPLYFDRDALGDANAVADALGSQLPRLPT